LIPEKLWFYWFAFLGIILSRYFLIAGGTYLLFYSILGKSFPKRELRRKPPRWRLIKRDVELAILSAIVFALGATIIMSEYDLGVTLLYTDIGEYGLWYLGVSFIILLILQDTYFYFIHRLFHHPFLFKWLHQGHHLSGEPTPWTSFAFDPPEAIVQMLFFLGIVFIIPLHYLILLIALMIMTVWAVFTHLGFELCPSSFPRHWLGKWLIGPTHHSIHHRKYKLHYGLYFTWWDKLLGTHDSNYENEFVNVQEK
jgi:sterol desaturase/sphingolipid hydroxylase (fatty acid hydroxylase superfamily)